MSVISNKPI